MYLRLACCFIVTLALGCNGSEKPAKKPAKGSTETTLQPVSLALNWFPEAEHGGYYAALAAGYYAEEGLDVKLIPGGPGVPVIQNVARGETLFGVGVADEILLSRAQGADVVALMSPLQNSPRCIMVHEDSGITNLKDLKDVTLAMRTGIAFSEYLQANVPLTNVKVVPYTGSVAQFLLDKRYAQQAYVFSEPFLAQEQGAKPRSLMLSDLGYNPYTSLLFARGETIKKDADLTQKMVRASVRGWQKYLEDPTAANEAILKANPDMTAKALEYGVEAIKPLCLPNGAPPESLGKMTIERWQELHDQLEEIKLLDHGKVKVEEAYRRQFLP